VNDFEAVVGEMKIVALKMAKAMMVSRVVAMTYERRSIDVKSRH